MNNASILNIYCYPVKSLIGETLSEADIGEAGIAGDRGWAVRGEKRGSIRGGKKTPSAGDPDRTIWVHCTAYHCSR